MKASPVEKADALVREYVASRLEGDEGIVAILSTVMQGSLVAASLVGIAIMLACSALAGWSDVGFVLGVGLGIGLGLLLMIKWKAIVVTERRLLLIKKNVSGTPIAVEAEYALGCCKVISVSSSKTLLKIACDSDSLVMRVSKPWFDEASEVAAALEAPTHHVLRSANAAVAPQFPRSAVEAYKTFEVTGTEEARLAFISVCRRLDPTLTAGIGGIDAREALANRFPLVADDPDFLGAAGLEQA